MNYCSSAADATTLLPVYTLTQMKCAQHLTFKSYTVHILLFIYCCTTLPVYTLTQLDEVCSAIHIKVIYCSTSQSKFQCTIQSTEEMKSSGGVLFSICSESPTHSGKEIGVGQEWCINGCRGLKVARKKLPRASKPQNFPFQPDLRGWCLQSHYSHSLTQALPSLCWGICFLDKRRGRRSPIFAK